MLPKMVASQHTDLTLQIRLGVKVVIAVAQYLEEIVTKRHGSTLQIMVDYHQNQVGPAELQGQLMQE